MKNQLWMLAVPFLAQNQMIMKVLRGEPLGLQEWVFYLVVGLAIAGVLWFIAARMYHKERLAVSA